eukprot:4655845-Heterocapsa_arctica.AAC.1
MRTHITRTTTTGAGGPWGAAGGSAVALLVMCFRVVLAGRVREVPRRVAAPPYLARGHIILY